ncbi:hypothetical protein D9K64_25845 [Klebsiella pneumoniae]|nr:hypothetical protein D9K64_25845 [Klebsiella pneumoniae]
MKFLILFNIQCYSLDYGEKTGLLRSPVHYGKRLAKKSLPDKILFVSDFKSCRLLITSSLVIYLRYI